ncbi:MAG: class I SAM-dependent methyltransferase [Acidobacteriota bacterium]
MKTREAYKHWSSTYDEDRNLTRDLDQTVTRNTLANLRCKSVLEIGCGTGKNTALLAEIGEKVYAFDFSEPMIEKARQKLRAGNVSFVVTDLGQRWPCKARAVDLISCNLVLEHIRDLPFIFAEAHRALEKKGVLFISELHPFRQYQGTKARFERDQQTTRIEAFVHHLFDFTGAAADAGFSLSSMKEWWHEEDRDKPPRLVSFMFEKQG